MATLRQIGQARPRTVHPAPLRWLHWLNATAVLVLAGSGWTIYNAAPFFPFSLPAPLALGGDLTGALRLHFAFMWLLAACAVGYAMVRLRAAPDRAHLWPVSLAGAGRNLAAAVALRLRHAPGHYNDMQRLLYLGVLALLLVLAASGLALWKPVQLHVLSQFFGGYEMSRRVHFAAMAGVVAFVAIHTVMALAVPMTALAIVFGLDVRLPDPDRDG